jgi:hypothetical protein
MTQKSQRDKIIGRSLLFASRATFPEDFKAILKTLKTGVEINVDEIDEHGASLILGVSGDAITYDGPYELNPNCSEEKNIGIILRFIGETETDPENWLIPKGDRYPSLSKHWPSELGPIDQEDKEISTRLERMGMRKRLEIIHDMRK